MSGQVILARNGQISGDPRANFETLVNATAAEVFHDSNVFWSPMVCKFKELADGQIAETFTMDGDSPEEAEHQNPGQFIEGGTIVNASTTITCDEPLMKAMRLPEIDEIHSKFPIVDRFVRLCTRYVTEKTSKRAAVALAKAARTSAVANVHGGGKQVSRVASTFAGAYPTSSTGAANLEDDFAAMAQKYDEDNIPQEGRIAFINPALKTVATRSTKLMNKDYVPSEIVSNYQKRVIGMIEGFTLVITNQLPKTNITTDLTKYNGNFLLAGSDQSDGTGGETVALFSWAGDGMAPIGAVTKGMLRTKVTESTDTDTKLCRSKIITGIAPLHVWLAGELRLFAQA